MTRKPAPGPDLSAVADAKRLRKLSAGLSAALSRHEPREVRLHEFKPATGPENTIRVTLYATFDVPVPEDER